MSDLWDIVNDISAKFHKISDEQIEESYDPFLVNRAMSYHIDTILAANLMNTSTGLSDKMQYLFYINSVTPKKRFSKWGKKRNNDLAVKIAQHYKTNLTRAEEILSILPENAIEKIIRKGENHE